MLFSSNLICGLSFHFYFSNTRLCCCLVAESCPTLLRPPWTLAHQASLSVGFCRQEYWSGFPFPSPGEGLKPTSPALADTFFTIESPAKPLIPLKGYFPLLARTSLEEKSSFMVGKKRMSCPKAIHLNMFFNFSSHHETSKNYVCVCVHESHSVLSDSLRPHGLYSPRNSPGLNTGVQDPFSRGSSQPGDQTQVSHVAGGFFTS